VVGADWSFGFATTDSLADSQIPPEFGRGVRAIYADIIDERVPDHLGELVAQLENRDGGAYEKAPGKSSESRGQEISLQKIVLTRLELCPSLWNALVRRRRVGRERRLRSEGNVTSGLGRPKAGSGLSRKRGARPSSARSVLRRGGS
jgi:hypothetical protein